MKQLFFSILILLNLAGCSYNHKLISTEDIQNSSESSKPSILAIDARNVQGLSVTANPGAVHLTVDYGDALIQSIKNRAKYHFKKVHIIKDVNDTEYYDFLMQIRPNVATVCGGSSCYINNAISVDIKKNINDKKNLLSENFNDQYVWQQPGGTIAIGIISGFTLCAICPITIPAAVDMEGEELSNQVSQSNERISARISEILGSSDIFKSQTSN